jgi:putative hydrolase of the HAD superfamily
MLPRVSCIAFDAVGTLIYPDPPVAEVYARVGREHGSVFSVDEVRVRFREAFRAECEGATGTNEDEERLRWRRIVQRVFALEKVESCFEELFAHFGRAESWRCFPDVGETLHGLSKRGYDLVLASNFDRRLHAICDGHAELRGFSARVISSEVGMFKPHAGFFVALLDQTGCQKDEVLMVGDDWTNDISGPLDIGMPVVFLDRSQTAALTRKDGVPVISSLLGLLDLLP